MEYLGKKTALSILKALFDNPLNKFNETELIIKAKSGTGSAHNLIGNMVNENILAEERVGKTKLISLNLRNPSVFLLKSLFDQEKLSCLPAGKLAPILFFKNEAKQNICSLLAFGSTIAGTYTEKSDIDLLVISDKHDEIGAPRKKTEELFGERLNLHIYSKDEINANIEKDNFLQNAFFRGVLVYGFDNAREIFAEITEKKETDKLFFFIERIKAASRNCLNKEYKTAEEIIDQTLEQIIFYLLSEKGISSITRQDAKNSIKKLSEGKTIQKIYNSSLKDKIALTEELVFDILKKRILEAEGYA